MPKIKKHIVIFDLFAGKQSFLKAIENKYEKISYFPFDIYSPDGVKNIIFDLSQDNIIEKLKEIVGVVKPDFIWASPLCTPFSRATSIKNGTLSYRVTNGKLKIRTAKEFKEITHKAYVNKVNDKEFIAKHQKLGEIGLKLFENTKKIIDHYNVPFVIENPAMAVSKYIMKDYIKNDATYCMYGFDYKKRTSMYSNVKLDLKICNHKGNHKQVMSGNPKLTGIKPTSSSNKDRSIVPPLLIEDILNQLLGHERTAQMTNKEKHLTKIRKMPRSYQRKFSKWVIKNKPITKSKKALLRLFKHDIDFYWFRWREQFQATFIYPKKGKDK